MQPGTSGSCTRTPALTSTCVVVARKGRRCELQEQVVSVAPPWTLVEAQGRAPSMCVALSG